MLAQILAVATDYLLILMSVSLGMGLLARYFAYRSSRDDQAYYSTFTREVEKKIQEDSENERYVSHVDEYIDEILNRTSAKLPERKLRSFKREKTEEKRGLPGARVSSVNEYVGGKNSLIHGLQSESHIFKGHHPPNFEDVTSRIMEKDLHWMKLKGILPIDKVARMIDALPGLFIVIGIFGTFLGISNALPQIAGIDFNNFEGSSGVLSAFVLDIAFAMKTSIAGILCSITLSLINTLFPIMSIREDISRSVETTLENLWYFVQGETPQKKREETLNKIINTLEQQQNTAEKILKALETVEEISSTPTKKKVA